MRGLIYKDISIFFKSIDKKLILIAAAAIVLLIFNAGIYIQMIIQSYLEKVERY